MGSLYFTKENGTRIGLLETNLTALSDLATIDDFEEREFEKVLGHKPKNVWAWVFVYGKEYQLR
ncbi:hypothetical protein [Lactobacillus intestinalis]|uniref:hypothetical protein n=1 Tax=Lactobacillus intestinalis TaxID=151781 RepID=UPI001F56C2F5|nr:hypothetical protein [Lactobacillus intestinalis]